MVKYKLTNSAVFKINICKQIFHITSKSIGLLKACRAERGGQVVFDVYNISPTVLETSYSFLASSKLEFTREHENILEHSGRNYVEGFPK